MATNGLGPGPASAPSNAVTPATTPSAPTAVTATAGDAAASVAFAAPASNGGAPITGYTVVASPGGASATGTASPIVVSGLTNGTSVHVRRYCDECGWHGHPIVGEQCSHAGTQRRGAVGSDGRVRDRRQRERARDIHRSGVERRLDDHRLRGDESPRRNRGQRVELAHHDHHVDERDDVHLHRCRSERVWHWP